MLQCIYTSFYGYVSGRALQKDNKVNHGEILIFWTKLDFFLFIDIFCIFFVLDLNIFVYVQLTSSGLNPYAIKIHKSYYKQG